VNIAVAAQNYDAYNNGVNADIFLKTPQGTLFKGRVWPGAAVFPDWFHSNTQQYWNSEFAGFFNPDTGVDIDALWIDMNEPSNFCEYPCTNPEGTTASDIPGGVTARDSLSHYGSEHMEERNERMTVRGSRNKIMGSREEIVDKENREAFKREANGTKKGLPGRDLLNPAYKIRNEFVALSNKTADTDIIHQGGYAEYDTHNL
jgi:alpha-glucosidase